ncbi:MAG: SDR family oxidoreductase [Rhodospirillales bacterium]|nr:SDR family oxidoreductase [Rhodospirillales bacterium]
MESSKNHLFCFGMGYCAKALARLLPADSWTVSGSSRSVVAAPPTIALHVFDGSQPMAEAAQLLAGVSHLLITAGPGAEGDPTLAWHRRDIEQCKALKWVGYLSTTGVYGNTDGALVTEDAALNPSSARSQNRVEAETAWLQLLESAEVPVHIFRLPGIYGPGRSALDQVQAGRIRRIDKPGHKFSRIHVDDIAQTLAASMARPDPGRIYNVCDDEAASPADVMAHACTLLQVPVPAAVPYAQASQDMSPMALSFWQDNRRVDNGRIKAELGVRLRYPSYREGLAAIHQEMES